MRLTARTSLAAVAAALVALVSACDTDNLGQTDGGGDPAGGGTDTDASGDPAAPGDPGLGGGDAATGGDSAPGSDAGSGGDTEVAGDPQSATGDTLGGDLGPVDPCRARAADGTAFAAPVRLSDPTLGAVVPSIAASGSRVLVAWHEFSAPYTRIAYSLIEDGCVGPLRYIEDAATGVKRPSVAAVTSGWVIGFYTDDVRAMGLWLDADGVPVGSAETLSTGATAGQYVSAAAAGDDVLFAWTDGNRLLFAIRGPRETVAASPAGAPLVLGGAIKAPRAALDASGTAYLVTYDSETVDSSVADVLLYRRPAFGSFGGAIDVSRSPADVSDDPAVAALASGAMVAWVEERGGGLEVSWAVINGAGTLGAVNDYPAQGAWAWAPSLHPSGAAVWVAGGSPIGAMVLARSTSAAAPTLAGVVTAGPDLAIDGSGGLHVTFYDNATPRGVWYARGQ